MYACPILPFHRNLSKAVGQMRFDRPEVWTLAAVFAIALLVLAFGHIAEEMLEGDATKFDERILLFFRSDTVKKSPL